MEPSYTVENIRPERRLKFTINLKTVSVEHLTRLGSNLKINILPHLKLSSSQDPVGDLPTYEVNRNFYTRESVSVRSEGPTPAVVLHNE